MTDDMIALQALLAKQPDADIVREMLGFTAQRLMELDVEGKTVSEGTKHDATARRSTIVSRYKYCFLYS